MPRRLSFYLCLTTLPVIAIGCLVLFGWFTHNALLVQISPSFAPMKFNTALCLIIISVGLLCVPSRRRFALAPGLLVMTVGLLTLWQRLIGSGFDIDNTLLQLFFRGSLPFGTRMTLSAASALTLLGAALSLLSLPRAGRHLPLIIALMGSFVAGLGTVSLIGYVSGEDASYAWGSFTRTAMHTGFCFLLLGIAAVVLAWKQSDRSPLWLPVPLGVALVTIAISISAAVYTQQDMALSAALQAQADHIARQSQSQLNDLYRALDRMADRWEASGGTPLAAWSRDVQSYLRGYPYLYGISRLDASRKVERVEPLQGNEKYLGFQADFEPIRKGTMDKARQTGTSQVTEAIMLKSGSEGFLYITPLFTAGHQPDGFQIGVFRLGLLFTNILRPEDLEQIYLSVSSGGQVLFTTAPQDLPGTLVQWQKTGTLINKDKSLLITVTPTEGFLASHNSPVPWVTLAIGLGTALISSFALYLMLRSQRDARLLRAREIELANSNLLNKAILSSAAHLVIATDTGGRVISFNPAAERALGYTEAELKGVHTPALWHDPLEIIARSLLLSQELKVPVEPGFEVFTRKARMGLYEETEWTFIRKDGTRFPGLLSPSVLRDSTGDIVGYLGIIQDVTESNAIENALRNSEETFRSAMEYASIGMALLSPEGRWLRVNKALCAIVGYSEDELLNLDFQTLTHPDDLGADLEYVHRMLAGGIETYQMEKRYFHKNGHIVWVLLSVSLSWDGEDRPQYFISQIQDITLRKQDDAVKEGLLARLTQSNTELERFAYVASHDMQEPMRMVANFSQLIAREYGPRLDAQGHEYITLVTDAATRMQAMIADLLDYARVGNDTTRFVPVDADKELEHVLDNLSGMIERNKARITHDALPSFRGNPVQFMRLLQNLIGNGLKYQAEGTVPELHVGVQDEGDSWCFSVRDNGIGMDKEHAGTVFQPFIRLHTWQEYEGTGIGLAVCKKIVENHGGTIWMTSEPGKGSVFYFSIPKNDKGGA